MRLALIILASLLATGCVLSGDGSDDRGQVNAGGSDGRGRVARSRSPWTDPGAVISQALRLTTPSGIDLREAVYIVSQDNPAQVGGSVPDVVLRLRDYTDRSENKPDQQYLVSMNTTNGGVAKIETADDLIPVSVKANHSRTEWVLNALIPGSNGEVSNATTVIRHYSAEQEPRDIELDAPLHALGFRGDGAILARPLKRTSLDGGLPVVEFDWDSNAKAANPKTNIWQETTGKAFLLNQSGGSIAGYQISHEPSLPGSSIVSYHLAKPLGSTTEQLVYASPYHITYAKAPWEPVLCWIDDSHLAVIDFLPDATGVSSWANHNGLFRLVSIGTRGKSVALVEDHMSAGLPVIAGGGVVFYTRQNNAGDDSAWELWASSADGLAKQRLWAADGDTIMMAVLDQFNGRRILVQRQYLTVRNDEPLLLSELTEFSLDELEQTTEPSLEMAPLKPFEQAGSGAGLSRFAYDDEGGLRPPPIAIPE